MKKIIFSFLICVFSVLFFVGCGPATSNGGDTLQSLSTPTQPQVERVEDRIIVSTSKVENAKAYQFSINNVNFTVNSNIFDCTNYLLDYGTYTFKVVAIADNEKYSSSQVSNSTSYVYNATLVSPVITIYNNTLLISNIENVISYEIYINNIKVASTIETSIDLANFNFNIGYNTISVKAIGNEVYLDSDFSNEEGYVVKEKLSKVENLSIIEEDSKTFIIFNEVKNASSYIVKINNIQFETSINLYDITQYVSDLGNYTISVKAVSNSEYYINSEEKTLSYSSTQKLLTPTLTYTLNVSYVEFEWNAIEFAKTYTMYINNNAYSRLIWSENDNKIISQISKDYLNKYLKPLNICIVANGYDNYLDSDLSNIVTINSYGALSTPQNLQVNAIDGEFRLSYDYIENAFDYTILVNDGEYVKLSKTYYVDLTDILTDPITYRIKVKANKTDYFDESEYSVEIEYINKDIIPSPSNPEITIEDNIAYLSWDEIENVSYYIVKFISFDNNDNVKSQYEIKNITETNYVIVLSSAGKYGFNVVAINTEANIASLPSITVTTEYRLRLNTISDLEIKINEEAKLVTVTWGVVKNAVEYLIYQTINGEATEIRITNTTYYIAYETEEYERYTFSVVAIADPNGYWSDSAPSIIKSISHGNNESGEMYYYNGEENPILISTQEDFNNYISYNILQKNTEFEVTISSDFDITLDISDSYYLNYKNYIDSKTDVEYLQQDETILNEFLTALYSYNRDIGGVKSFEIPQEISENVYKINLEYYFDGYTTKDSTQQYIESYKTYMPLSIEEMGLTPRSIYYTNFKIDSITRTEKVKTTDQLLDVVMYLKRKPEFELENSVAEEIYNSAKVIIRKIISDDMTEFQKICAIYDYLAYNIKIDKMVNSLEVEDMQICSSHYLEGVFKNKIASSIGISKAFSLLCAIEGIESRYVLGYRNNGTLYAVNKVKLNNNWYIIDIQYSCSNMSSSGKDYPTHYFNFLVADSSIKSNFTELTFNAPSAVSSYDYYANTKITNSCDLLINSRDEFEEVINKYISLEKEGIECKISSECNINELISALKVILGREPQKILNNQLYLFKLKY